ncbi:MAG: hypothetical protein IPN05_12725 [Sulfuritalea sp.]|nr:hypothetical protein [Sulfuritalea sp.]
MQELTVSFPHLKNLRGMSRSVEDWIMDNIVHPLKNRRLMSVPDVIETIGDQFDVYGSSPQFLTDWRWYKEITGASRAFNELALLNYYQNNLNLLDYRFQFPSHTEHFGRVLEGLGNQSWEIMCRVERGDDDAWGDFYVLMEDVCAHIQFLAPETTVAIREAVDLLKGKDPDIKLNHFPKWWGRGQQYLSLIRRSAER